MDYAKIIEILTDSTKVLSGDDIIAFIKYNQPYVKLTNIGKNGFDYYNGGHSAVYHTANDVDIWRESAATLQSAFNAIGVMWYDDIDMVFDTIWDSLSEYRVSSRG